MILIKKFTFDAAHNLVRYKGKCERLHGHTYQLVVKLEGKPHPRDGMVMDFTDVKALVGELVIEKLDHNYLNDTVAQSTAENLAMWIWDRLAPAFRARKLKLLEIELWETATSGIVYRKGR
ncbi:MAG: 6-carboxytetrahydropterin synthase QueD [Elusimicrobiaceae bacterium]|nr:6-carboxytetrahydropterin synthase QueD [Elusimicrobiaceae bacterium]